MNVIFIYKKGTQQEFPITVSWITRQHDPSPVEYRHSLCGVEADVVVSDAPLSVDTIKYAITRLRNPMNVKGGRDFEEFPICLWREDNIIHARIHKETMVVNSESWYNFVEWLEDCL